jgi:hypothetical protein
VFLKSEQQAIRKIIETPKIARRYNIEPFENIDAENQ